jgi:hypothetical protein
LSFVAERAHDAEIHGPVLAVLRNEDIARVHVGMEKAVAERLREEDLHAVVRQQANVDAARRMRPSMSPMGMPCMRSSTITVRRV